MDQERWHEISRIFHLARKKSAGERSAFLAEVCGDDAELRRELEDLLSAGDDEDSFIDRPGSGPAESLPKLESGQRIGAFEIIRMIGAGGMGEVYLARDLRLNRQVALKILLAETGLDAAANRRFLREAQSAAALEHPYICTIHEIGRHEDLSFIVMQYVEGETLSARIKNGSLSAQESLEIAIQVGEALREAHSRGIIHRDIKPANIILSAANQVKVLDFGLAKRVVFDTDKSDSDQKSNLSNPGMIVGTTAYMSPEHIRGCEADARTDLWSLGIVLYEMLFGRRPFSGENSVETLAAILYREPEIPAGLPVDLEAILEKALQKDPELRYQAAGEMIADLRHARREIEFTEQMRLHTHKTAADRVGRDTAEKFPTGRRPAGRTKGYSASWTYATILFLIACAGLLLALGGWEVREYYRASWARDQIPRIEQLAREDRNFEAYDLAVEVSRYVPDSSLREIMPKISDTLTVSSEPAGARVFLRRFQKREDGQFPAREFIGETPVTEVEIARGSYILLVEKEGYAPAERTISGSLPRIGGSFIKSPPLKFEIRLLEKDRVPPGMVFVPGGEYSLVNWSRPTEARASLSDFFIDKYEVTNAEFREFILAGGYWRKEYWKHPIVKEGRQISIDEALRLFRDKTGLPGPRQWTAQNFPEDEENHPVTGITWYEAAAYAEFRGKSLPTVFQWEKAARNGMFDPRYNAMPWGFIRQGETTDHRANFRGRGTVAVTSNEFGMSPFGAFNMAGNVSEWNLNQSPEGYVTSGGAWNDLVYSFGDYGVYPGLYSSDRIGFRCALNTQGAPESRGAEMIPPAEAPVYTPSTKAEFRTWRTHYEYDRNPLRAEIVEAVESDFWRREKITFAGEDGDVVIGYLYLPKNYARPLQVIHYVPPGDVVHGIRSLPDSVEMFAAPFIKSGRAVFAVVLRGYIERPFPENHSIPDDSSVEFRKQMVNWITDLRRGVDYLETREDLDRGKLAFLGISNGANLGLILTAVETRYAALIFQGAGLDKSFRARLPETSPIELAPHVRGSKLLINGRYDETFPYNTDFVPLVKLLREPKKIITYEGGHIAAVEFFAPAANGWLDETLGAVIK